MKLIPFPPGKTFTVIVLLEHNDKETTTNSEMNEIALIKHSQQYTDKEVIVSCQKIPWILIFWAHLPPHCVSREMKINFFLPPLRKRVSPRENWISHLGNFPSKEDLISIR